MFGERYQGTFSLTSLGDRLRCGQPAGMRSWATFLDALGGVRPFEHILDTVKTGGQERTNDEYSNLLRSAGLKPGKIQPVAFPYGVIEGLAA